MKIIRAGDGSPEGERLKLALDLNRRKLAKYGGYDIVRAADALAEIARVISPHSLGLQQVGDRRFVGPHGEFVRVVEVAAMKGAAYAIRWGVSLPYVPLGLKKPLRYGRTMKSARLSIWWGTHRGKNAAAPAFIGTLHGLRCVRDEAEAVWQASQPAAIRFWDRARDLPGVLEVARELMTAPGAQNWGTPLAGAVAALTAARLGLEHEAREYASATPNSADEAAILAELIDRQLDEHGRR